MSSETPRTDTEYKRGNIADWCFENMTKHARQLERENAAKDKEIERLKAELAKAKGLVESAKPAIKRKVKDCPCDKHCWCWECGNWEQWLKDALEA